MITIYSFGKAIGVLSMLLALFIMITSMIMRYPIDIWELSSLFWFGSSIFWQTDYYEEKDD